MSGTVTDIEFTNFPIATWRLPGAIAQVDPSAANTGQQQSRTLLIGQMAAAGTTAIPGVAFQAGSLAQVQAACGATSMVVQMLRRVMALDNTAEIWILPLANVGTAATGTITIAGAPTASGTISPYIGGVVENVVAGTTDTPTSIATRLAAAINLDPLMMVSAAAVAGVVTLTADHLGLLGNDIDLRLNYRGVLGGEANVPGLTITFAPMTGGTGIPALPAALAALTNRTYDFIGHPYQDTASLNALQAFLNDSTGRWSPLQELFGHTFSALRGNLAALQTAGVARNDQHATVIGFYDSPSAVWDWAADLVAVCGASQRADPGVPLQYLAMNVLAPPDASLNSPSVRNSLLYDGISTFLVQPDGTVETENIITTYQLNIAGAPDDSYLEAERMGGLTLLIRDMRDFILTQFPRKKLVIDGTRIPPGSNMVTSQTVLASCVARYRTQCNNGNAQDPDGFAAAALGQNAGRGVVKLLLPFRLPNQLRLTAMLVRFTAP